MIELKSILAMALCLAYALGDEAAPEPLRAVASSGGFFSNELFKQIAASKKGENLISSPLSAHMVLSMAAYGARGKTAEEMFKSLHLPADNELGRQGFQLLIDQLNNVQNVTLEVANKMYLANNLKLKSEFKQLTGDNFRSEASTMDTSKPKESANMINGWVKEKTHEKISEIVNEGDIKPDTRMVLLNAVYFKGGWAHAFDKKHTEKKAFHLDNKNEKMVDTMFLKEDLVYGELHDLKAKFVELPYKNNDLKMVIIVPDEIEGLSNIIDNLQSFNQTRLSREGWKREVNLYLPKFKIESEIDLEQPLKSLNMTDMWSDTANFGGISDESLRVGKVKQKAFIEVNEEGSEAAAVTVVQLLMKMSSFVSFDQIIKLRIDRPFYYMIKNADVTLFQGYMYNP